MKTEAKTRDLFELARRTFFAGEKDATSENKHPDYDEEEKSPNASAKREAQPFGR